jgi:biopolymer transport protein ExbD
VLYVSPPPSDTIMWNNQPIALSQLRGLLEETQTRDPVPELHLQPDPQARYDTVDKVLAETKKAEVSKMGFIGNEAYRGF